MTRLAALAAVALAVTLVVLIDRAAWLAVLYPDSAWPYIRLGVASLALGVGVLAVAATATRQEHR